jgi:CubicO group peptidase (beta-lactamase class C family)
VTKSFISALIGIAIEQGYIKGVNEKLFGFFPEYRNIANLDERKKSIILKDVLTMTAGFWCNPDSAQEHEALEESSNWIKYVLDKPMNNDPGAVFLYDSGCSHLLLSSFNFIPHPSFSFIPHFFWCSFLNSSGNYVL